jgi:glycine/D-amino acid oxidase-like deaminating enzyme
MIARCDGTVRRVPRPWSAPPTPADRVRYADAEPTPFWVRPRAALPVLEGRVAADLCIVGGGFTGLWAALLAKGDEPSRSVVVLEGDRVGAGASGRNGGFVDASLTHGIDNGLARFADEIEVLERLGHENFAGMRADLDRLGVDCAWTEPGEIAVSLEPHEDAWLEEAAATLREFGHDVEVLDGEAMRAEVASPTYRGGLWNKTGAALVDPGRLGDGLLEAALAAGVGVFERSPAVALEAAGSPPMSPGDRRPSGRGVDVRTPAGAVAAQRVVLATSAYRPLLRRLQAYVAPVYDYVLVTEPLTAEQRRSIGWELGQGLADMGNRFHYYRLTPDGRILFGGYEAVYRYGGPVLTAPDHQETFALLSRNFITTFPQLEDVRFAYRWGGAIDTCSRFSVFFGTALGGRASYALGYTGLGVGATRFGARVALDLVDGRETEATRLRYVRRKPVPFPPEPLRTGVIALTRNRLAAADDAEGRRGVWLRTLDRLGLGFDS